MVSDLVAERPQGPGRSAEELAAALEQKQELAVEMRGAPKLAQRVRPAQPGVVVLDLVAERPQGPGRWAEELAAALAQKLRLAVEMQVAPRLTQKAEQLMKRE